MLVAVLPLLVCAAQEPARDPLAEALRIGRAFVALGDEGLAVERWTADRSETEQVVRARELRIRAELEELDSHPWAGAYVTSNLGGPALVVAPQGGAVYYTWGCVGPRTDFNHGDVVEHGPSHLRIELQVDPVVNQRTDVALQPRRFVCEEWLVVPWGSRRYLVPATQMVAFCNAFNASTAPSPYFPHRDRATARGLADVKADGARPIGLPELPPQYRPFLLRAPIEATVTRATAPERIRGLETGVARYDVLAEVDRGYADGLLPGMLVFTDAEDGRTGEVVDARERDATVAFRFRVDVMHERPRAIEPGRKLSTRGPSGT